MPLAIELAAAWAKTLPCSAIAAEIERNLAFLEANLRDLPERHRSMRAVFDQSWQLLAEDERSVFSRLSVFRGGFTREAVEAVLSSEFKVLSSAQNNAELKTQNSELLTLLAALVDKSLIWLDNQGRYQIHELLRQYAESRLAAAPDMDARTQEAHSAYYLRFLSARATAMAGGRQREATLEIAGEIENIRAAWQRAVDHVDIEAIRHAEHPLSLYYAFRGPYQDGIAMLDQAIRRVRHAPPSQARDLTLARLLIDMGMRSVQLGQLAEAKAAFEAGQSLYTTLAAPPPPGLATDPLIGLGLVAVLGGDLAAAARYGATARQRSEADQHSGNLPFAWYVLAVTAQSQGQIKIARHYAQQAHATARAAQNRWFMSSCLIELNNLARFAGEYAEARQHAQAAHALREEFGDWQGMAVALYRQGRVAVQQTDYPEARRLFQRSLAIAQEAGDRSGCATGFYGLALVASRLGEYDLARRHFVQALEIVTELKFVSWSLAVLAGIAELLLQLGQPERAGELSVLILRHPAAYFEENQRAQNLLLQAEAALAPTVFAAAVQRGQILDLDTTVARLQIEFAASQNQDAKRPRGQESSRSPDRPVSLALVERLTERELEVLRLIGDGLSNQAIANRLVLSYGTIRWYTQQIYGKLGVQSRTQALVRAKDLNLLV
jgi:DNA-binding CsgD family transcriptional regulator/tetratricopeptide (TPR) repeat protein